MALPVAPFELPLLLVSVRDEAEARAAMAGGCGILDVKEPRRGPLGMADRDAIAGVIAVVSGGARIPVSAALGEAADWIDASDLPKLPPGLDYAKLGLAELRNHSDWSARWREVRDRFDGGPAKPVAWVAVSYVDWELARAPRPEDIIEQGAEAGCPFVLFDTWKKQAGTLLDRASPELLADWIDRIHRLEMRVALAGSVTAKMLPEIVPLQPDVIAVRGAVCDGLDRTAAMSELAVRAFKEEMASARLAVR